MSVPQEEGKPGYYRHVVWFRGQLLVFPDFCPGTWNWTRDTDTDRNKFIKRESTPKIGGGPEEEQGLVASGPELSALRPYKVSYCIQQASWAMSTCTMVVVVVPDFLLIVLYTLIYNIYIYANLDIFLGSVLLWQV